MGFFFPEHFRTLEKPLKIFLQKNARDLFAGIEIGIGINDQRIYFFWKRFVHYGMVKDRKKTVELERTCRKR